MKTLTQAFLEQFNQLPENMKQEVLAFAEYLIYKQQNNLSVQVEDTKTVKKPLKAGFLKGTFLVSDSFEEPLEDFKDYMQ